MIADIVGLLLVFLLLGLLGLLVTPKVLVLLWLKKAKREAGKRTSPRIPM